MMPSDLLENPLLIFSITKSLFEKIGESNDRTNNCFGDLLFPG